MHVHMHVGFKMQKRTSLGQPLRAAERPVYDFRSCAPQPRSNRTARLHYTYVLYTQTVRYKTEDRWRGYRDAGRRELVAGVDDTHGRGDDTVRSHAHASIRDQALMHATDLEGISPYDG